MRFGRSRVASTVVAVVVVALSLSAVSFAPGGPAGAASPANETAADNAVAWLRTQQQADGGFDVAAFQGFETPDVVLAIAEAAQTGGTWSTAEAAAAVLAIQTGGKTAIDSLDAWVTAGVNAGEAAKILLLVVYPLGLDPADFGPSHHNLASIVSPGGCASPPNTTSPSTFFIERMYVALGGELLCGAPDAAIIAEIRAGQRPEGGWNYDASLGPIDPSDPFDPNRPSVDPTAAALQALIASGAAWNDPAVLAGLAYLKSQQASNGSFPSFGSDDPNATAVAALAISTAGFDPDSSCWRDTVAPSAKGTAYTGTSAWLRSQQQGDGHIASPSDGFGVNTFASSQSVQALLLRWLPIARATGAPGGPDCVVASGAGESPESVTTVDLVVRFTG